MNMAKGILLGGIFFLSVLGLHAQLDSVPLQDTEGAVTVITSERLVFDHKKQFAEFETNVVITDPRVEIKADFMKVWFNSDNRVKIIQAEGHVYIRQDETEAWAGRAEYLMEEGKMVLRDKPQMSRGQDILTGDVITFYRDENKMIVEPRARLVIFPQGERGSLDLPGAR